MENKPCICSDDPRKHPFSVCGVPCAVHYDEWIKLKEKRKRARKYNTERKKFGRHPKSLLAARGEGGR